MIVSKGQTKKEPRLARTGDIEPGRAGTIGFETQGAALASLSLSLSLRASGESVAVRVLELYEPQQHN